ncbi:hypothetical protein EXE43_09585 [Halorubrum sp. SS5]|nr:hypothetical protein EXE43_09585 [Halorubrum sp. SS5]
MTRFPPVAPSTTRATSQIDRADSWDESNLTLIQNGAYAEDDAIRLSTSNGDTINYYIDLGGGSTATETDTIDATGKSELSGFLDLSGSDVDATLTVDGSTEATLTAGDNKNISVSLSQNGPVDVEVTVSTGIGGSATLDGELTPKGVSNLSGTAFIEWSRPETVFRWDALQFDRVLDGETVDLYVEESTDGGSSWTEVAGPVSEGDRINVHPDNRVRFRAELSRSTTASSPRLNAAYRRYIA